MSSASRAVLTATVRSLVPARMDRLPWKSLEDIATPLSAVVRVLGETGQAGPAPGAVGPAPAR